MSKNIKFLALFRLVIELKVSSLTMLSDFLGICRAECVKVYFVWHNTDFLKHHLDFSSESFDNNAHIVQIDHNICIELLVFVLILTNSLLENTDCIFFHLNIITFVADLVYHYGLEV